MSKPICRSIDDHEWVSDRLTGPCYCQACGLALEDAEEAHVMEEIDKMRHPSDWVGLIEREDEGDD